MRFVVAVLWLAIGSLLYAQDLTIKGETRIDEVERIVVVKEKITVVTKLPFTIEAPLGGPAYSWEYPSTIMASRKQNVLTVTAGKGLVKVSVEWSTAEIKNGIVIFNPQSAVLTFAIGEVIPPKPPEPMDAFTQKIIDVWKTDTGKEETNTLIELYRMAIDYADKPEYDTTAKYLAKLKTTWEAALKDTLPALRKHLGAEENAAIGKDGNAKMDAKRDAIKALYAKIIKALEQCK